MHCIARGFSIAPCMILREACTRDVLLARLLLPAFAHGLIEYNL
jgi:hypothetical protein